MPEPEMTQLQLIKDARNQLSLYESIKNDYRKVNAEFKQQSKQLSDENKAMENDIASAVRRERSQIEKYYSGDLRRLEDDLKKAQSRKDKTRSKGVKKRIRTETAPLKEENEMLKEAGRSELRDAGISPVFNTPAFYRLFSPKGILEIVTVILLFLIIGAVLPACIYFLIPERKLYYLVILCAALIALQIVLYICIHKATKGRNQGAVLHARKNYDLIRANKRKIKALTRAIETDTDESMYKLGDLNETLSRVQGNYDRLRAEYEAKIEDFEMNRQPAIEADIRDSYNERIQSAEESMAQLKAQCEQMTLRMDKEAEILSSNYTSVIGKRFMKEETLMRLEEILGEHEAESIEEAIEVLKSRK